MFGTVKRIIAWCGDFRKNLYIGFVFSFFSGWFAAMPVFWAAYVIGKLVEYTGKGKMLTTAWVSRSIGILLLFVFLRFLFDYLRARFQEAISYELIDKNDQPIVTIYPLMKDSSTLMERLKRLKYPVEEA